MKGTHRNEPEVELTRFTHLVIESEEALPVHADGEILWTTRIVSRSRCCRAGLRLLSSRARCHLIAALADTRPRGVFLAYWVASNAARNPG